MVRVAVGFGSNIGDRQDHLDAGLGVLSASWTPVSRSSLYESAPVGPVEQGPFLNAVAVFETSAGPAEVLSLLLAAEQSRGRTREVRWGPRTLDLDLLLYGDRTVEEPGLTVPHPELTNRRFVLEPLLEAWPEAALPDGTPLGGFLPAVRDQHVENVGPWNVSLWRRTWWRLLKAVSRKQ
ncbi:MAG: 2-amino-4-hydroxy-6-hydroxymethyldihydropteridine diphosphokinase [Acidimicrobiia bacterium]|nr:2-amino-4-hydroxy-6-hydroxymethyldihydropteridine diphosphokinase [Acidimicrobiia bacterium]